MKTTLPKSHSVVLALWPEGRTPFARVGAGENRIGSMESFGSVTLLVRLFDTVKRSIHGMSSEAQRMSDAIQDVAICIRVSKRWDASVSLIGHDIYYADADQLELTAKMMRKWNAGASSLYYGATEDVEALLRRTLAGMGIERAVLIYGVSNEYRTVDLDDAIQNYVMPAIQDVLDRLPEAGVGNGG